METVYTSEVLRHWAAGVIEGEGAFVVSWKKSTDGGLYPAFRVQINMTDRDVLDRLKNAIPGSRLSEAISHKNAKPNWKPFYRLSINKRFEVFRLLSAIHPIMGSRRSGKIEELISVSMKNPPRPRWKHATRQGYERGCRCEGCKAAHAKRFRERRSAKKGNHHLDLDSDSTHIQ